LYCPVKRTSSLICLVLAVRGAFWRASQSAAVGGAVHSLTIRRCVRDRCVHRSYGRRAAECGSERRDDASARGRRAGHVPGDLHRRLRAARGRLGRVAAPRRAPAGHHPRPVSHRARRVRPGRNAEKSKRRNPVQVTIPGELGPQDFLALQAIVAAGAASVRAQNARRRGLIFLSQARSAASLHCWLVGLDYACDGFHNDTLRGSGSPGIPAGARAGHTQLDSAAGRATGSQPGDGAGKEPGVAK